MLKKLSLVAVLVATCGSLHADGFAENFATDPAADGWRIFGDAKLFNWNNTNHVLDVTWDSGDTNSYFYHPLGTVVNRDDDFSVAFDLILRDIGPGPDPRKVFRSGSPSAC